MPNTEYYDGTKLLSLKDIEGNVPEIYICTSNRTAGKTTFWNRYVVNRFLKHGEKFALLYRYNYELTDVSTKFFKDIQSLFFLTHNLTHKTRANGAYAELFLDDVPCGYALTLNNAENVKKQSHLLIDTRRILFDEFQSETNSYCPNEINKFQSIHASLARGQGEQARYLPVIMVGNPVSIINPYYTAFGISSRLKSETKFLRGKGFVLEQGYVESAGRAQLESGFNKAFEHSEYLAYSAQNVYLNDSTAFIETMKGNGRYMCTLKYKDNNYGVRLYPEQGIAYINDRPDLTCPYRIAVTTPDHNINYVMLNLNNHLILMLRLYFEKGCFRFKDLLSKECLLTAISYQ